MSSNVSEWPALDDPTSDRLMLRDGTVAIVRPSRAEDLELVRQFFHQLSTEALRRRFFSMSEPAPDLVARFCRSSNPARDLTLIAFREHQGRLEPIAVASYSATASAGAEAAFAVADGMHGKGLGTALLERLAVAAARHGLEYFEATTLADNQEMLEVFRDSGFELRSRTSQGVVDVRLVLEPSSRSVGAIDERNRTATVASMRPILEPRSVAVFGVSRDPSKLGRKVFDALARAGFNGPVYPVNPSADDIDGHRCYHTIADAPAGVELAIVVAPASAVLRIVDECAAAGVKSLVVVSAGFAEIGADGRTLQQAVLDQTRAHGMRMVGPNCMGVINANPDIRLNASFVERVPPPGRLAIASQSGGVGLALLDLATTRHLGVSTFVSLGNKADVSSNDLLQWSETDPRTSVLLLYLESFGNPRRFAQLARRIGGKKPIVAVKAGRTAGGRRAAGSHTAGLASNEAAVDALFRQSGVIRADTIDEMFDVAQCLDLQPLPQGQRVGIVTNAGGPGILAADACEAAGLVVTPFAAATRDALARQLSDQASVGNPVDLIASAGAAAYEHAVVTALASPDIDSLIVNYTPIDRAKTPGILDCIGRAVATAREQGIASKPVLVCTFGAGSQPPPVQSGDARLPCFMFPENAAKALGRVAAYARWRSEPLSLFRTFDDVQLQAATTLCHDIAAARGDTWLTSEELRRLLNAFGLTMVAGGTVRAEDEAAALADVLGYPVVMKVSAPDILHKTDAGAVRLHLQNDRAVRAAFRDLAARFPDVPRTGGGATLELQPMLEGVETLVGVADDPTFGPLIAFGLGGVDIEILRDVAFRIAPLTEHDVDELMHAVRSFPLLDGHRGRPRADVPALREVLSRISLLAQHVPELLELDLNPIIVLPAGRGCRIVDARARVAPRARPGERAIEARS